MNLPLDFHERVYAGVLGKIIGVYLGRPFEQRSHEWIDANIGEIWFYVHDRLGQPLIVADDDISGTFTFVRAMEDYGDSLDLTPKQIGQTWLNYIIEGKTILWWGGMGTSTEHTAYMRLKQGIKAPLSGSIALNGRTVAEQIGSQIFIDGWGLLFPNDPEKAADFARRAGSVSHDGEAIYGAQMVAAMVSAAFSEGSPARLIETTLALIPQDSQIARLIREIQEWHAASPSDWRKTRAKIAAKYGYDKFGGGCHMVPNHALIIHALLHGDGDFQKSQMIVNTCGWDTDCNAANVGCILGVAGGLTGLGAGPDFRGPVADRLLLPTADGGRCISDALAEADRLTATAHRMRGLTWEAPKSGARFHFSLPGSVQGWRASEKPGCAGALTVENQGGALSLKARDIALGRTGLAATPTFLSKEQLGASGYALAACPTLYPGQKIAARLIAPEVNEGALTGALCLFHYCPSDDLVKLSGPQAELFAGEDTLLEWVVPETGCWPIAEVGIELSSSTRSKNTLLLDWLDWKGAPSTTFAKPLDAGTDRSIGRTWQKAWVNGLDQFEDWDASFRCTQNEGTGLAIMGCRDWRHYEASTTVRVGLAKAAGIACCVQGMKRWIGLLLADGGKVQLVQELDGRRVLAEEGFDWELNRPYELRLACWGSRVTASVDGVAVLEAEGDSMLAEGAIAFVVEEGRMMADAISIAGL